MIPEFASLMVKQKWEDIRTRFGLCLFVFYFVQVVGLIVMLFAPFVFHLFSFKTQLPTLGIIISYILYRFIEQNQSLYSQLLTANNNFAFYPSAIISGCSSICLLFILLSAGFELDGVIAAYSIPLILYPAWKWPIYVSKLFGIEQRKHVLSYSIIRIKNLIHSYI
jgi:hypothetical protein